MGLSVAYALAGRGVRGVTVFEAEDRVARHQTGHNSGVIHSGLYYEPGSLKAETCRKGREALYRFCDRTGVPYRKSGKLVVATRQDERDALVSLARRGRANGLEDLHEVTGSEIERRAPGVAGVAGLWVGATGLTDFGAVARAIRDEAVQEGVEVRTGTRVLDVRPVSTGIRLHTTRRDVEAGRLVNCAGLESDRVARMCGVDPELRIVPFRGDYLRIDPSPGSLQEFPVYPVPDSRLPFLGVHLTPDLEGNVEAGPNAALAFSRYGYELSDFAVKDVVETMRFPGFWRLVSSEWRSVCTELASSASRRLFLAGVRKLVPEIELDQLGKGRSGVRAQAVDPDGSLVDDFRILRGERSVHVLNVPSPAATACLAIGDHVAGQLLD